jgi:hypothetical protein
MATASSTAKRLTQLQRHIKRSGAQDGAPAQASPAEFQLVLPLLSIPTAGVTIDLSGKVAIVTGATGQLGRVMVRTLATAGCDVAVHYRSDADGAASLCEEVHPHAPLISTVFGHIFCSCAPKVQ